MSGLEERVAEALEANKVSFAYEAERIPYQMLHNYTPDFRLPNGIFIEVKGLFEPSDRTKHLEVQKQHPNLDIRFVFSKASMLLSKNSKTTYAAWCVKHGFQYAEKVVPKEWIHERKKAD